MEPAPFSMNNKLRGATRLGFGSPQEENLDQQLTTEPSFEEAAVEKLWDDVALIRSVVWPTGERALLAIPLETKAFLSEAFQDWIHPLREELLEAARHRSEDVRVYAQAFQAAVLRALHRPLASADTRPSSTTGEPLSFDERISLSVLSFRALLAARKEAFAYLDRLWLDGAPVEDLRDAWTAAVQRNELLKLNQCLGISAFPLYEHREELAQRGLAEKQGVCHRLNASALEMEEDTRAHHQGLQQREHYQQTFTEVSSSIHDAWNIRKVLLEIEALLGNIPDVTAYSIEVANQSRRFVELETRKASMEKQLRDEKEATSRLRLEAAIQACSVDQHQCTKLLRLYRGLGVALKGLTRLGIPALSQERSLGQTVERVTHALVHERWPLDTQSYYES